MTKSSRVKLPHAWKPYPWQRDVLAAFERGIKRFLIIVHRRAGKDQVGLNMAAIASQKRVGQYWHVYPYASQVRAHIWKGMDKREGVRFTDQAFPEAMRSATRDHAMELEFKNDSLWRCIGSDNYEALRGGNPVGVVFSEFAFADPESWQRIAPILRENGGWAAFITTPFGKNHCWEMYEAVKNNPEWYVVHLTVEDTLDWNGNRLITDADIQAERESGTDEASIRMEYYCDWNAVFKGAYYANELRDMRSQGRITKLEYNPKKPVYAAWDLGFADELVVLFFQKQGEAHYCIGSRSWTFTKFEDALDDIGQTFPWTVAKHLIPHDVASKVTQSLVLEAFEKYGDVEIVEKIAVATGIQTVREMFPTLWIDNAPREWAPMGNNGRLIEALGGYRTQQARHGVFSRSPLHSWESHWADALRYYAVGNASGALRTLSEWGSAPDYAVWDKASGTAITTR